jgi:hypothetical protein
MVSHLTQMCSYACAQTDRIKAQGSSWSMQTVGVGLTLLARMLCHGACHVMIRRCKYFQPAQTALRATVLGVEEASEGGLRESS